MNIDDVEHPVAQQDVNDVLGLFNFLVHPDRRVLIQDANVPMRMDDALQGEIGVPYRVEDDIHHVPPLDPQIFPNHEDMLHELLRNLENNIANEVRVRNAAQANLVNEEVDPRPVHELPYEPLNIPFNPTGKFKLEFTNPPDAVTRARLMQNAKEINPFRDVFPASQTIVVMPEEVIKTHFYLNGYLFFMYAKNQREIRICRKITELPECTLDFHITVESDASNYRTEFEVKDLLMDHWPIEIVYTNRHSRGQRKTIDVPECPTPWSRLRVKVTMKTLGVYDVRPYIAEQSPDAQVVKVYAGSYVVDVDSKILEPFLNNHKIENFSFCYYDTTDPQAPVYTNFDIHDLLQLLCYCYPIRKKVEYAWSYGICYRLGNAMNSRYLLEKCESLFNMEGKLSIGFILHLAGIPQRDKEFTDRTGTHDVIVKKFVVERKNQENVLKQQFRARSRKLLKAEDIPSYDQRIEEEEFILEAKELERAIVYWRGSEARKKRNAMAAPPAENGPVPPPQPIANNNNS